MTTTATNYKVGQKVTVNGLGFGYINDINEYGYTVYFLNQKRSGDGYKDYDMVDGWKKTKFNYFKAV